jgi:protein-S-isoprenylcysteine O-methyltransferase Ste14
MDMETFAFLVMGLYFGARGVGAIITGDFSVRGGLISTASPQEARRKGYVFVVCGVVLLVCAIFTLVNAVPALVVASGAIIVGIVVTLWKTRLDDSRFRKEED